ncbi:MAG: hypothetical protein JKY95_13255 [Planctomycetaceae bacterium]|nr:hypothetical protein [Planctomycetaceae bacterium]
MTNNDELDWLPDLIPLVEYDGDWKQYLDAIYQIFRKDFLQSKPRYASKRFALKKHPIEKGKEATFWHLISDGKNEDERTPDLRRCERIAWPRPIIEAIDTQDVFVWRNKRGRSERILIALHDFSYVVVLDDREDFVLLWTAYYVEQKHRRRKMEKEYKRWKEQV